MKGKTNDDKNAYLTIYAYPHKKKFASKKTVRQRQTLTLTFSEHNTHSDNERDAMRWRDVLWCLIKKVPLSSTQGKDPLLDYWSCITPLIMHCYNHLVIHVYLH